MTHAYSSREAQLRALLEARLEGALTKPVSEPPGARRRDPGSPVPLSPIQRSIWLLWQYQQAGPAYNVPFVLRLRGSLDRDSLLGAVRQLAQRHTVLRSVVVMDPDGEPATLARPATAVPVHERTLDVGQLDTELHTEANRPFDLRSEPPMRVVLFRIEDGHHVLAMTFHHIAVDAYARAAIFRELSACFQALAHGRPEPPPPVLQYADAVESRRNPASVEPEDLGWWVGRLADLGPALDLPACLPRSLPPWPAGTADIDIGDELYTRLKTTAAESGCTLFMVLLAALNVFLARTCDVTDIVVGTPESGRPDEELRDVIGCFVNTLAIRLDLSGDPTGTETLRRAREAALDSFSHATVPFEQVVAAINPERNPRTSPVFQVMLNVYDNPSIAAGLAGVEKVDGVSVALDSAKFDLVWHFVEDRQRQGLRSSLVYRADMFERASAERMTEWFRAVLESLLADPRAPISTIALERFAGPVTSGPRLAPPVAQTVHELTAQWARRTPDAVAVVGSDHALTYAQLDRWAESISARLQAVGVQPRQPVGLLLRRGAALVAAIMGTLKAGAYYVPLDPAYPPDRINGIVAGAGIATVVSEPELADGLPGEPAASVVLVSAPPSPDQALAHTGVTISRNDPVYAVFTSGSTGQPKGVLVEHGSLLNYLQALQRLVGEYLGEAPSFALVSTIAADLGFTNVFGALATGGTVHVLRQETSLDPRAYASYLGANRVDVIKMVPSHLQLLATHGELAEVLPRRLLILAGEACPWSLVDRIRSVRPDLAVHVHYGPAETTVSVLGGDVNDVPLARRGNIVPLGRPLANVDCYVIDPQGRQLPAGVAGELLIGGPCVARGYLGRPDLTAARFVPDPVSADTRCYRTGDRVRATHDGQIEFLGRLDDQVKIRGFRVELAEVQAALRAAPGVADAIVLAPDEQPNQKRLLAWVSGPDIDLEEIRAELRRRLPDYMIPAAIVVLDRLPLNANGKVDRAELPIPQAVYPAEDRPRPRTLTEEFIAKVWREVLDVEEFGVTDNFFALGGDSFLALRAIRAIGPQLRITEFVTRPTVRSLAALLDSRDKPGTAGALLHSFADADRADDPVVTLVCIPYGGGTASAYHDLAKVLDPSVRLVAVELPGHDPAGKSERLWRMPDLVDRLAEEIARRVVGPVAVYGHSSGTATAVVLAGRLESEGIPVVGVVVGARLPHPQDDSVLSDADYARDLREMGGLTSEMDGDVERAIVRNLRHDAEQAREWFAEVRAGAGRKLAAPLLCVVGEDDPGTRSYERDYLDWRSAAEQVDLAVIPGAGHYFLKYQAEELAALITERFGRPRR
jgi:amino acid adenylation domain-containing protein